MISTTTNQQTNKQKEKQVISLSLYQTLLVVLLFFFLLHLKWLTVFSLASLGKLFFILFTGTLQYGYNVNTTVRNNLTVSAQSKNTLQGMMWLLKHRFVHGEKKTNKQTTKTGNTKKELQQLA